MNQENSAWGVLCALPQEFGSLGVHEQSRRTRAGLELCELRIAGVPVLGCVSGIGKVLAARAASVLITEGATRGLFVVGTCGGLVRSLKVGALVHCTRAHQTDLGPREGREVASDPRLRAAWQRVVPGEEGWFLTADRPVLSLLRRLRLSRAFRGPCVAEMETAAVGAVAQAAGVPWAALRAVTDAATPWGGASFHLHLASQGPRAADSIPALLRELEREPPSSYP
jgi:adenosylhomocysteine nucleosidase